MKNILLAALFLGALLVGCVSQPPAHMIGNNSSAALGAKNNENESNFLMRETLISVIENNSTIFSTAYRYHDEDPQLKSPIDYAYLVGLTNTNFGLNKSLLKMLDPEESVWIGPPRRQNNFYNFSSVDVIYFRDINECNPSAVMVLGNRYPMSDFNDLARFDPTYHVVLDKTGGCLKHVVLWKSVYLYPPSQTYQINLFDNDPRVILKFESIQTQPKIEITASPPSNKSVYMYGFPSDNYLSGGAAQTDASGVTIEFQPALESMGNESMPLSLSMGNSSWIVTSLRRNNASSEFYLVQTLPDYADAIEYESLAVGDQWRLLEFHGNDWPNQTKAWKLAMPFEMNSSNETATSFVMIKGQDNQTYNLTRGYPVDINGTVVLYGNAAYWFGPYYRWVPTLYLVSDSLNLTDQVNQAKLTWQDDGGPNPKLESIFIPRSSPAFEKIGFK